MSRGKLIVLEGLDGSGKATQAKQLAAALTAEGRPVREITFPNYESDSSALVRMYLAGQFGEKPDDVNAYAASSFYAVDRYAGYKADWGKFYEEGGILIADRYTTSNAVHQCSKLPPEQWDDFLRWAFDYEYRLLGLPAPDAVFIGGSKGSLAAIVDAALDKNPDARSAGRPARAGRRRLLTGRPRREPEADDPALPRRRDQEGRPRKGHRISGPQPPCRRVLRRASGLGHRPLHGKWSHAHHRGYSGRGAGAGGKRTRITAKMGGILSMYRLMQPSDEAAVVALWQKERGDSAEFIKTALEKFAGAENIYVAEENDEIVAAALAVPVTLKGRSGSYLYGLCGQGSLLLAGLVDYLCAQQKLRGAGFVVVVPAGAEQAALLQDKGFQWAFPLRCLPREVERNLWSQAEFDSVTARKLCELRERFYPDTVQFPPEQMAVVLGDLYSRGATIVSNNDGYGIYFRKEDTLYFVELMAENDRAAEILMEAAREKEVIVEKAVITVGAAQNLFLGEGTRQDYGMIRFEGEPFDVSESYMRLMLD